MRIAILSWESLHSIAIGGLAAHVSELTEVLAQQGHEVHIFTRIADGQSKFEQIDGVHYHRCAYESCQDFVSDMDNMCRSIVNHVIATEDMLGAFDIVHAHDWLVANAMIWLKQARGRRCIMTIHSTEYGRCGNTIRDGISERIRERESAGVFWADQVIAVSQVTKDEVIWLYEVPDWKISVIHNGVFARRFNGEFDREMIRQKHGLKPEEKVVLFCGRLATQKGPDLLLEALPEVISRTQDVRVIYAGDGDMKTELENRTEELGLEETVGFLGYQQGKDLPAIFHAADIVCIPSRNEPFGIVVLEAWSARRPVVVTRIGGPREFVTDHIDGIKIEPTPDEIADALVELLDDPEKAREMGIQGRRTVEERFTWTHIAIRTMAVYDPSFEVEASVEKPALETAPARVIEPKSIHASLQNAMQELTVVDYRLRYSSSDEECGPYWEELLRVLETCTGLIREQVVAQNGGSREALVDEAGLQLNLRLQPSEVEPKPTPEWNKPPIAASSNGRRHKRSRKIAVGE